MTIEAKQGQIGEQLRQVYAWLDNVGIAEWSPDGWTLAPVSE